jgi:excisionase family DNA binding protein
MPDGHSHREPATQGDVLTAKEVAEYLQIPVRSVHEYATRGELPSVRIGRHRRFSRRAVEAVMDVSVPPSADDGSAGISRRSAPA